METTESVKSIMDYVKRSGDEALLYYAQLFDKASLTRENLRVDKQQIQQACDVIPEKLKQAVAVAARNIETFHRAQLREDLKVETMPGVICMRRSVPIQTVGLYIPGGNAPLFSTVLMLGIPARLAGCPRVILCTPPRADGTVAPEILYCARECGITEIFKAGGAAAIGAMAYGTETIPRVDKIFGPGNAYVTAAKQWVGAQVCATDLPAGPSEVVIAADDSANDLFVCADFLSQLEHGPDSRAALITTDTLLAAKVKERLQQQAAQFPKYSFIEKSLKNSIIETVETRAQLIDKVNSMAPEHLIVSCKDPYGFAKEIVHAGSIFLGNFAPESAGDYASGTNHTLPTGGWARAYSGVSTDSFTKQITLQDITPEGLKSLEPVIEAMAQAEGFEAHINAVKVRL